MRRSIPILLNLFLFPMGYFYLRNTFRVIAGGLWIVFAATILKVFFRWLPESSYGWPQLGLLALLALVWVSAVLLDTGRLARSGRPQPSGLYKTPVVYLIAPVTFLLILVGNSIMERTGARFIRAASYPSEAMAPSLLPTDYFYWKPFMETEEFQRGDIVVYALPSEDQLFVSRIIGLPGDSVELIQSESEGRKLQIVKINGESASYSLEDPAPDLSYLDISAMNDDAEILSESIDGFAHLILDLPGAEPFSVHNKAILESEYFLMSDNRDSARDSRLLGPIPSEQIQGKVMYVYLSLNEERVKCDAVFYEGTATNPCEESSLPSVRWGRIGLVPR